MQNVSERFAAAMKSRPYIARITLDTGAVIEGDAISGIDFRGGANANSEQVTVGSTVAATAEITMDRSGVKASMDGRKLKIELGIVFKDGTEWLDMGNYVVTDPKLDDDSMTVVCMDEMATALDKEYEPLTGFDFESAAGVSSNSFMAALCKRRGIEVDLEGLEDVTLRDFDPVGATERKIVGWFAALHGRFAAFSRTGVLQFKWYETVGFSVSGDAYYENGMEIAEYDFRPRWLKCYNECAEETLTVGSTSAEQGIYFECPWMSAKRLASLYDSLSAFSFRPVKELSFFGDPRLEAGDIITLEDCNGGSYQVPVMSIAHEFDGGVVTEVSAQGQSKTDAYEGPVQSEVKRAMAKIVKRQGEIDLYIRDLDGDKMVALINLSTEGVKIQAANIKLEGLVTANGGFKVLEDGSVEANAGKIGGCTIKNGVLTIDKENVKDLFTKDLQVSGTFTQTAEVFFEPGTADLQTMYELISCDGFTEEQIPLYDFDGDGYVSLADYMTAYAAMIGKNSLSTWSGAVKSNANVTIDLKDPNRAIRITGTNMWGRAVEKSFGLNMVFAEGNTADTFETILQQTDAFKELKARVDALEKA